MADRLIISSNFGNCILKNRLLTKTLKFIYYKKFEPNKAYWLFKGLL